MIVPDLLQICEIMLFSEGFEGARVLAKKMTTLYKLAQEQLSKQVSGCFCIYIVRAHAGAAVEAGERQRRVKHVADNVVTAAARGMIEHTITYSYGVST